MNATTLVRLDRRAAPGARWRHGRLPVLSLATCGIFVLTAAVGPLLVPHDPLVGDLAVRLIGPTLDGPDGQAYLAGTDQQGRDVVSRLVLGCRTSMLLAGTATLLGAVAGTVLGMISGLAGGTLDSFIMRVADAVMGFPTLLIALVLAVSIGPSAGVVLIVLCSTLWARYARLVRGETLAIKQKDYVTLARTAGLGWVRIMRRHVFPNLTNSVVVLSTLQFGYAVMAEASLSFLGAGVPPPQPTWGGMIADGRGEIDTAWWIAIMPGLALGALILAINVLGDWLRDRLDPSLS